MDFLKTMKSVLNVDDSGIVLRIENFKNDIIQASSEHLKYLSTYTVGTERIIFSIKNEYTLIEDIFRCESYYKFGELCKHITGIDLSRNVAANPVYLAITYVMYTIENNRQLNIKEKERVIYNLYFIMAFKMNTSLYFRYYHDPFNEQVARAAFEKLSGNFIIKRVGSWNEVYKYRANNELTIHAKRIKRLDIEGAMYFIADVQGRWRRMLVELNKVLYNMRDDDYSISITSLLREDEENGLVFNDTGSSVTEYSDKILGLIYKPDFLNLDLVYIIVALSRNITEDKLLFTLRNINDAEFEYHDDVLTIIPLIFEMSFLFLKKSGLIYHIKEKLEAVIHELKNMWSGSRRTEPQVVKVRKVLETVIKHEKNINKKSIQPMSNLIPVYIFLLAIK